MTAFIIFICMTVVLSAPLPENRSDDGEDAVGTVAELESVVSDTVDHVIRSLLVLKDEEEAIYRKMSLEVDSDNDSEANAVTSSETLRGGVDDDPIDIKVKTAIRTLNEISNADDEAMESTDSTSSALIEKKDSNNNDDENTETAFRAMIKEDDLKRVVDREIEASNRAVTTENDLNVVEEAKTKSSSRTLNKEDNLDKVDDQGTEASKRTMTKKNDSDKADEAVTKASDRGLTGANAVTDNGLSFSYGTSFSYGGSIGNYVPPAIPPPVFPAFNFGDFYNIGAGTGIPYVPAIPAVTAVSDMLAGMFGGFSFG